MARQEIEDDMLTKTKVLVLPFVIARSDKEVEKIHAFVNSGGPLIADCRCGLCDMHDKLRQRGTLDDVFAIQRADLAVRRRPGAVAMKLANVGCGAKFESTFHDAVRSDGSEKSGVHEDGIGAFFINHHFGKGRAAYLNTDLYEYPRMRKEGTEVSLRETMRNFLTDFSNSRSAFISGPFIPEHEHGHPVDPQGTLAPAPTRPIRARARRCARTARC